MIVVSVLERELGALRAQALAQVPHADRIELRLDHVGAPGTAELGMSELGELVRAVGKPVIAAVNGPDAHGFFRGERAERFATLANAARAGAAFIDVDWKDAALQPPLPAACRRIVSRHEESVPDDIETAWRELEKAARPDDVLKLVAGARCGEDGVRMLESVRGRKRDVVGFASGDEGAFTRVLAPIFGSSWTYAAPAQVEGVPQGTPSAPGQLRADVLRGAWPVAGPSSSTRVFAVVGNPVRHSLSPRLHAAALRSLGLDAVYVAIAPSSLEALLSACRSPAWSGFSVTAPFKSAAFRATRTVDAAARETHAANTLVAASDATWTAHNTDVPAIAAVVTLALRQAGRSKPACIAVVGSGGAARAAVVALRSLGAVTVFARNAAERDALARELGCSARALDDLGKEAWDVLVHCTPVGSLARPGMAPVDERALIPGRIVMDAVYRPALTPLLSAARDRGATIVSGTEWFARQAALQFELFTTRAFPEDLLRRELESALNTEVGA